MSEITEMGNVVERAAEMLIENKFSIAFAESATAGRASAEFSMVCDAGKFLKGRMVCYDAELKCSVLHVPHDLLEKYTPESMEVTAAIAQGLAGLIPADIHIGLPGYRVQGEAKRQESLWERCFCIRFFRATNYLLSVLFFRVVTKILLTRQFIM